VSGYVYRAEDKRREAEVQATLERVRAQLALKYGFPEWPREAIRQREAADRAELPWNRGQGSPKPEGPEAPGTRPRLSGTLRAPRGATGP
jgi:hypothetical protein